MAFIQPCFIRKNTPELRKKLEELGYDPSFSIGKYPEVYKNIAVCNFFGNRYYGLSEKEVLHPGNISDAIKNRGLIDCGTNEDLFLAIAALRDDSDYMQWFTDGEKWFQNKQNDIEVIRYGAGNPINFHKAIVGEIIEHFKKD